jgi:hypothetical protein
MAEYVVNSGNQEILSKYMVPLSSAMYSKQLVYLVEPGLCDYPDVKFRSKSPMYSGMDPDVVRLGPMALFQRGEDPATNRDMLFKVTTSEDVEVVCRSNTVAIGYRYFYDPDDEDASVTYGAFSALSLSDLANFTDGVIVCLVEMGGDASVVRADSRFATLSNNLLRSHGFLDGVGVSVALPGFGVGALTSTAILRKGNVPASNYMESVFDSVAGVVKRRVVQGGYNFASHPVGVYVLGCVVHSEAAVEDGPVQLVCSSGGVYWFSEVVGGEKEIALELALQKVPFGVVIYGAVYWDGLSLLTSDFFTVKRTFADVVKRVQDVFDGAKQFAQSLSDGMGAELEEHEGSRGTSGSLETATFSHVALDSGALNGLSITDGLIGMRLATNLLTGTVVVPGGNGLSVADGSVSLALAEASTDGGGGSAGALSAVDKEKLDQYPNKDGDADKFLRGDGSWVGLSEASTDAGGSVPQLPTTGGIKKFLRGDGSWNIPPTVNTSDAGYAPKLPGDVNKFLNGGGEWSSPPALSSFDGATDSVSGSDGLVPGPAAGDQNKFLRGDGKWDSPPSQSVLGVPSPTDGDKGKVLKATGAGTYGWGTDLYPPSTGPGVEGIISLSGSYNFSSTITVPTPLLPS